MFSLVYRRPCGFLYRRGQNYDSLESLAKSAEGVRADFRPQEAGPCNLSGKKDRADSFL